MTIPGGGTDKVGNRYGLRWTVRQFIRLLRDETSWIHLESFGAEGEKIEPSMEATRAPMASTPYVAAQHWPSPS